VAGLWLIGGIDSRLRLGGSVRHQEFGSGTVASIAASGKVIIQFDGIRNVKTCRMQELVPVSRSTFSIALFILSSTAVGMMILLDLKDWSISV